MTYSQFRNLGQRPWTALFMAAPVECLLIGLVLICFLLWALFL